MVLRRALQWNNVNYGCPMSPSVIRTRKMQSTNNGTNPSALITMPLDASGKHSCRLAACVSQWACVCAHSSNRWLILVASANRWNFLVKVQQTHKSIEFAAQTKNVNENAPDPWRTSGIDITVLRPLFFHKYNPRNVSKTKKSGNPISVFAFYLIPFRFYVRFGICTFAFIINL